MPTFSTRRALLAISASFLMGQVWAADESNTPQASTPQASAEATAPTKSGPKVLLKTNFGDIVLELDAEKAPKTTANFLGYVQDGFYSGTIFHRVISDFMIQGGGFTKSMTQKPGKPPIQNEAKNGLKNTVYTVAMARTGDPHSASSQFFINTKDNEFLDFPGRDGFGYAVFGKVISGNAVVEKIKGVPTGNFGPFQNVPNEPVIIESAKLLK